MGSSWKNVYGGTFIQTITPDTSSYYGTFRSGTFTQDDSGGAGTGSLAGEIDTTSFSPAQSVANVWAKTIGPTVTAAAGKTITNAYCASDALTCVATGNIPTAITRRIYGPSVTGAGTKTSGYGLYVTVGSGFSNNYAAFMDNLMLGGDLNTTQTTQNLFNTNATTVNAFQAATTINMGAAASYLYLGSSGQSLVYAGSLELGRRDGAASTPYIDFHAGATLTDYDARIICASGNGSTAQGTVTISAGVVNFSSQLKTTDVILSSGSAGGVGYSVGSGGTVTQTTSKSTAVTINKINGKITMNNAALAANAVVSFIVNNSTVSGEDLVVVNHANGGTLGDYDIQGNVSPSGGAMTIAVRNMTASSQAVAIEIKFSVIKGANS